MVQPTKPNLNFKNIYIALIYATNQIKRFTFYKKQQIF
jgi:hypothetical protein